MAPTIGGVCEKCTKGHKIPGAPTGKSETVAGITTHFSAGVALQGDGSSHKKKDIVLLTDIFGLAVDNPKILADELAKKVGVDVWVPDTFNGRPPFPPSRLDDIKDKPGRKSSIWRQFQTLLFILSVLPDLIKNRPSIYDSRVNKVKFLCAIKDAYHYENIGSVGYCLGGGGTLRLAGTGLISTAVLIHPTPAGEGEVERMKCPSSWLFPEEDERFGLDKRAECQARVESRKDQFSCEFKTYPGTVHGFAARPLLTDPEIKAAFYDCLDRDADWFKKTL